MNPARSFPEQVAEFARLKAVTLLLRLAREIQP